MLFATRWVCALSLLKPVKKSLKSPSHSNRAFFYLAAKEIILRHPFYPAECGCALAIEHVPAQPAELSALTLRD